MSAPPIVLFDGIPGSGKTTTSRAVAEIYRSRGIACGWALEEDKEHPFFGQSVRRRHRDDDFDEVCLGRWRALVASSAAQMWAIEGCALQSTVRFMFEQCWGDDRIDSYWRRFERIVEPAGARVVHLWHPRTEAFVREHTMVVRATVWEKIERHVRSTPLGRSLAAEGVGDVHVEFWVRYAALSKRLLDQLALPVMRVDVIDGWSSAAGDVVQWLDAAS